MYAGSRRYLREKWSAAKCDIEEVLKIYDKNIEDIIDEKDMERVRYNIVDNLNSIIREVSK